MIKRQRHRIARVWAEGVGFWAVLIGLYIAGVAIEEVPMLTRIITAIAGGGLIIGGSLVLIAKAGVDVLLNIEAAITAKNKPVAAEYPEYP